MKIVLSYTICCAYPWNHDYDEVGRFGLRIRKDPEEIKKEKEFLEEQGIDEKPKAYKYEYNSVYTIQDDKCYFLIGHWHKLKEALEENNEHYEIVDRRDTSLKPDPDYTKLAGVNFMPGQAEALASLVTQDCGLLCSTVGFGKSFLIKLLCMIYPTLNILVVCMSGEVVKELFRDLCNALPGEVGLLNMENTDVQGKRVIVTTAKSMVKVKPEQVQLLLVDECYSRRWHSIKKVNCWKAYCEVRQSAADQPIAKPDKACYGEKVQRLFRKEVGNLPKRSIDRNVNDDIVHKQDWYLCVKIISTILCM